MRENKLLIPRRSVFAIPGAVLASELARSSTAEAANYWALRHYGYRAIAGTASEFVDAFTCAENAGASPLNATRTAIGEWEKFDFIIVSGQNIRLKAKVNNKYVRHVGPDKILEASGTTASSATILYVETAASGTLPALTGGQFRLKAFTSPHTYVMLNNNLQLHLTTLQYGVPSVFYQWGF